MSDETPPQPDRPPSAARAQPAARAGVTVATVPDQKSQPSISPFSDYPPANSTLPPTNPATAPTAPVTTSKKDAPLPDIVLGGPQPFNAERSPLIRLIKLCTVLLKMGVAVTILGFMLYYYLSIANPKMLPKYDPKTGAGATPFKAINHILAMPAQVMGKTKDVVASNDERVADLDHVITVSEGKDGKARNQGSVYVPPTASESTPTATGEAAPATSRSAIGQIFALPGQVIGQTKAVVEKNNARTGVLDGVIANPEGMEKIPANRANAPSSAQTSKAKPAPPAKTSVNSQDTADLAQSLIDFGLTHPTAEGSATTTPAPAITTPTVPPIASPIPAPPATPAVIYESKKIQLGGGIAITTPAPGGSVAASETFVAWVMNVKVSGISPGTPSRVVLNERLVREGDAVHLRLAISFEGIDVPNRLLLFRDKSGATVSRSY